MTASKHILIIGAGITGLAAAHHLQQQSLANPRLRLRVTLLEATNHPGGAIRTVHRDGFLLELGPDNFITNKPGAVALCKHLGLEDQLLPTNEQHRRALVVRKGRLVPIPEGFELMAPRNLYAVATSPIFSLRGKLRMWWERFIPARKVNEDESLESFVVRRLGREALDRLVQPLVGGIYTADPKTLSLRATVPRFLDMETQHGSITAAMRKQRHDQKGRGSGSTPLPSREGPGEGKAHNESLTTASVTTEPKSLPQPLPPREGGADTGARYSLFMTLRDGMEVLPRALASKLGDSIRFNARVAALAKHESTWRATLADGETIDADGVILATPADISAQLLQPLDASLAAALGSIEAASTAIVIAAYRREDVKHPLEAFGFVVPHIENRNLIAGSFSHVKYAGRAPAGHVLLRAFVGGAMQPELFNRDDGEIQSLVQREFKSLLGITAPPLFSLVQRWPRSMPQYKVGHVKLVESIRALAAKHAGLELAGSAYDGVGIPDCITSAEHAAARLVQ